MDRMLNYDKWRANEQLANLAKSVTKHASEFTLDTKPLYIYRPSGEKWQYQKRNSKNKEIWYWVTNLDSVKALNKKYKKNFDVHVDNPNATKIEDKNKKAIIETIKKTGKSLGWTNNAIAAVIGNVGRENGFNSKYIYGPHNDPKTSAKNFGIISWTGSRLKDVQNSLKSAGLLQANGSAKEDLKSVEVMVKFMDSELDKQGGSSQMMRNSKAKTSEISKMLYKYIRYAMQPYNTPDPSNLFHVAKNHQWAASAKLSGLINYV